MKCDLCQSTKEIEYKPYRSSDLCPKCLAGLRNMEDKFKLIYGCYPQQGPYNIGEYWDRLSAILDGQ